MASSDSFVAVGEEEFLYIISNVFAKPHVFYYLVSDSKIFDIIYQLSPLLDCDPTVCSPRKVSHPRASPQVTLLFFGRQTVGSHSNKGDNCIIFVKILYIKMYLIYFFFLVSRGVEILKCSICPRTNNLKKKLLVQAKF